MNKLQSPIRTDRKPLQDLIPMKQPLRLYIDPCDICNFKCHFCFQSKVNEFHGTMMGMELFRLVVDQVKEFGNPINVIHLYGYGEPLLNPNIDKYVRIINDERIAKEVVITTNASVLSQDLSLRLVDAGLTRLSISLNGLSDEQFKKNVNRNVSFDKIYEEVKFFYEHKNGCHVHIKIDGEDYSEEEKKIFIELFENYCDSMNIDSIADMWPGLGVSNNCNINLYGLELDANTYVCPIMFYNITVHADGGVSPCGVDHTYKKQNLGNVRNIRLKQIWDGEELRNMWKRELAGMKSTYEICNKCNKIACASVDITPYKDIILERIQA